MHLQVLQSEVLAFVNFVAEIVHGFVDEFFGAPNKNLGESFVVVTALGAVVGSNDLMSIMI